MLLFILVGIVKEISISEIWLELLKILFSSLIMGLSTYWLSLRLIGGTISIFLLIGWGVLAYGVLLMLLKEKLVMEFMYKGKERIVHYVRKK